MSSLNKNYLIEALLHLSMPVHSMIELYSLRIIFLIG
jgi:hypothetical protein